MGIIAHEFASGDGRRDPFGGAGACFGTPPGMRPGQLEQEIVTASGRQFLQFVAGRDLIWVAPYGRDDPLTPLEEGKIQMAIQRHVPDRNWGKSEQQLEYEVLIARLQEGTDLTPGEISAVLRWQTRHGTRLD